MRILILRSNPIAPDPRVEKIARALSTHGYPVACLGWDRSATLPEQDIKNGVKITRLLIKANYGNGLGNLPQLLRWQFGLLFWLIRHRKDFDSIHACDFDTILPALLLKWLWKKKVVYDIFDFYADHLRRTPQLIKNLIRKVDLWAIDRAEAVILVDDARREQIQGAHPQKCISIYNSPEDVGWRPPEDTERKEVFSIAYVGLLQFERGIKLVLDLMPSHPNWRLELAGFGGDEQPICEQAAKIPGVRFYGRVAYDEAIKLSAEADVLFATYDPSIANHRYSSPNKVFEGMMLGKPIVVARNTNMDRIIMAAGCGIVVDYGDREGLEQALMTLQNSPEKRKQLGENGRRSYEQDYSWGQMSKRLLDLYADL